MLPGRDMLVVTLMMNSKSLTRSVTAMMSTLGSSGRFGVKHLFVRVLNTSNMLVSHTPCHTFRTGVESLAAGRPNMALIEWPNWHTNNVFIKNSELGGPAVLCALLSHGYPWNSSVYWSTDMRLQFLQLTPIISDWAWTYTRRRQNLHEDGWVQVGSYFQNILSLV